MFFIAYLYTYMLHKKSVIKNCCEIIMVEIIVVELFIQLEIIFFTVGNHRIYLL